MRIPLFRPLLMSFLLFVSPLAQAGFTVSMPQGDQLDVREFGADNSGPLFVWLLNQYGNAEGPDAAAEVLAGAGATVWQVDLLESLFLQRTNDAARSLPGEPVAALLQEAVEAGRGPIVLVACDRMAAPALRGLRAWQEQAEDTDPVAGGVLFFPNLYQGTPIAGEEPELLGIVEATNMPLVIKQPAQGTNRERLPDLLSTLHEAGSQAYGWVIGGVRDYYLIPFETPTEAERHALRDTPAQLLAAVRLLSASPRPQTVRALDTAADRPIPPAYGLIERPPRAAPEYALDDALGRHHTLAESLGRVTLVNFWATWCPPCVHEIPSMNRLAAAYDEEEFAIVSINFKEDGERIRAFMQEVDVDFPVLMDEDGEVSSAWSVFAFPSSFLLDRHGRIRYSVNTAIEWDTDEVKAVIDALRDEAR
jgi:thiol-disulfide isomerase/thioredoxin